MGLAQRSALRIVEVGAGSSDAQLLIPAIVSGDEVAVTRFCEATSGLLFGLLLRILGDTKTADEVLSEVYDEVRQCASQFNQDRDRVLTWLITIAHRRALERLFSSGDDQQFLVSVGLAPASGSGGRERFSISKAAHRRLVGATLNSVSSVELKMIELAYFSHLTPPAIGRKLGQSTEAVTAGLQCGILGLYKLFRNHGTLSEA
jgi:RNA polymerase sigma-70 factor (ECF subfamily)